MKALKFWLGISILVLFYRISYNLYQLSHLSLEPLKVSIIEQVPIFKKEELFLKNLKTQHSFKSIVRSLSKNSHSYELDITLSQEYHPNLDSLTSIIINHFQRDSLHKTLNIKSIDLTFYDGRKNIQKYFDLP